MSFESECIFCRIVRGQAEAHVVYHDDGVTAFLDIHPVTRGHLLVVPHRHAPDLASLEPQEAAAMVMAARDLAAALRRAQLGVDGVNLHLADGAVAGQSVFHAHLHVIPRYRGDGFGFRRPLETADASQTDLAAVADLVRSSVERSPS
jgi:diadenosine tetraphosphate (Ap4A) HIT family hydrolase